MTPVFYWDLRLAVGTMHHLWHCNAKLLIQLIWVSGKFAYKKRIMPPIFIMIWYCPKTYYRGWYGYFVGTAYSGALRDGANKIAPESATITLSFCVGTHLAAGSTAVIAQETTEIFIYLIGFFIQTTCPVLNSNSPCSFYDYLLVNIAQH